MVERKDDQIWWIGNQTCGDEKKLVILKKASKNKASVDKEVVAYLKRERYNNKRMLEVEKENNRLVNLSIEKESRLIT